MSQAVAKSATRESSSVVESSGAGVTISSYDSLYAFAETLGAGVDKLEVFAVGISIDNEVRANKAGVKKRILARREGNLEREQAKKMERERQLNQIELERARRASAIDKTMLAEQIATHNAELDTLADEGMAESSERRAAVNKFKQDEAAATLAQQELVLAERQLNEKLTENEKRKAETLLREKRAIYDRINKTMKESAERAKIGIATLNRRMAEIDENVKATLKSMDIAKKLEQKANMLEEERFKRAKKAEDAEIKRLAAEKEAAQKRAKELASAKERAIAKNTVFLPGTYVLGI